MKQLALLRAPLALVILTTASLLAVAGASPHRASAAGCGEGDPALDAEEVAFYGLLNQYRSNNGLPELRLSTNLSSSAAWLARDLGAYGYFDHTDRLGRTPTARANVCGYAYGTGENIAAGTIMQTAEQAFNAWRNSAGHNANMLDTRYVQVGIAREYVPGSPYTYYWVTDFGVSFDGTSGAELIQAQSGILSASLTPGVWNIATVLPGGLRVDDLQGWTAWAQLSNGWWQQYGPGEFVAGGSQVGLLPIGMSLDHGRTAR